MTEKEIPVPQEISDISTPLRDDGCYREVRDSEDGLAWWLLSAEDGRLNTYCCASQQDQTRPKLN